MDGEQEIIQQLGVIQGQLEGVADLKTTITDVSKIAQSFLAYAESRKELPTKLDKVDKRLSVVEFEFSSHCKLNSEESIKLQELWDWYKFQKNIYTIATALSGVASTMVILIVLFHEKMGLTFTLP